MRLIRVVPATGLLVAICALLILTSGSSRAAAADAPFKLDFDSSKIQVGALADLPLDALSTTASLEGTIDENGAVTIPKGKFKLPELGITEPVAIKGFMGIESPATGSFNAATGQLDLDAQAGLWVSVNLKQLLDAAGGLNIDLDSQHNRVAGADVAFGYAS